MHHHRLVSTMGGKHPGFLPVGESATAAKDATGRLQLKGVVFDMDGTLCTYSSNNHKTSQSDHISKKANRKTTCSAKCEQL